MISETAPSDAVAVEYDRKNLSLYAALLDAADAGEDWKVTAETLMGIDSAAASARLCWQSHLDRARWIVGEGLASALEMFGQ